MRRILTTLAALVLSSAAYAGDKSPFSGAYIGAHAGYSYLNNESDFNGWNLGAQGGYNFDLGSGVVAGVEGDAAFSTAGISGTDGEVAFKYTQDWLVSLRARLGYQIAPDVLPFVTGGIAWGQFKFRETDGESTASGSETTRLWVVGGGVDYHVPSTNVIATAGVYQFFDTSISDGLTQFRLGANLKLN